MGSLQRCLGVAAGFCRPAAGQVLRRPGLRRSLAALAGGAQPCERHQPPAAASAAALNPWHPAAGGGGGGLPPFGGSCVLLQPRQQLHSSRWPARAFTADDIEAEAGVMVEGEPAGVRCARPLGCGWLASCMVASCILLPAARP